MGDLDGDGVAEWVTAEDQKPPEEASLREELSAVREPQITYRFHRTSDGLTAAARPYQTLAGAGYALGGEADSPFTSGFRDLNGDGRQDLVALTLDFSLFQAAKILTTKRFTLGLDFHLYCQQSDGSFREVGGLDLAGKLSLNLNDLKLGRLAQFAGDFDGDRRIDFLQIGRGRRLTIHRGRPDCSYPSEPDLALELAEAPRDPGLVQVRDLDGDGLADLAVIQPLPRRRDGEAVETLPVRLELYLSGGGG